MTEKRGLARCESAIEVILAETFMRSNKFCPTPEDGCAWEIGAWPEWHMALLANVPFGPYRPDFVVAPFPETDTWVSEVRARFGSWHIIVEADGHDYHERTRQQAEHDRRRDRFFTERGIRVLRYTGSEIQRDAVACVRQVMELACRLQQPFIDACFARFVVERVAESVPLEDSSQGPA